MVLTDSLPASRETDLEKLRRLQGEPGEIVNDFIDRYAHVAGELENVRDHEKVSNLIRKLPSSLKIHITHLKTDCSLEELKTTVHKWEHWTHLLEGGRSRPRGHEDKMELGAHEAVGTGFCAMRDVVIKDNRVDFSKVTTANTLMIAWKHLMTRSSLYRGEAERF